MRVDQEIAWETSYRGGGTIHDQRDPPVVNTTGAHDMDMIMYDMFYHNAAPEMHVAQPCNTAGARDMHNMIMWDILTPICLWTTCTKRVPYTYELPLPK